MMQGSLPTRLRVFRAERGLTLRDAAALTGVRPGTLSELERGLRHPHDITLSRVAKGYGVPVEELLEEPALAGKAEAPSPPETPEDERRAEEFMSRVPSEDDRVLRLEKTVNLLRLWFALGQKELAQLEQDLAKWHGKGYVYASFIEEKLITPVENDGIFDFALFAEEGKIHASERVRKACISLVNSYIELRDLAVGLRARETEFNESIESDAAQGMTDAAEFLESVHLEDVARNA